MAHDLGHLWRSRNIVCKAYEMLKPSHDTNVHVRVVKHLVYGQTCPSVVKCQPKNNRSVSFGYIFLTKSACRSLFFRSPVRGNKCPYYHPISSTHYSIITIHLITDDPPSLPRSQQPHIHPHTPPPCTIWNCTPCPRHYGPLPSEQTRPDSTTRPSSRRTLKKISE